MVSSKQIAILALAILLINAAAVFAQEAALSDEQATERLAFISQALESGQSGARRWWYGWIGLYAGGAATMGVLAARNWESGYDVDNSSAQDMLIGSGTFALGVIGLVIDPFTPATAAKKLGRLPESSASERLAKLKRAEELLRQCAKREKSGRSLTTHLLNAGVNAAAGIVTVAAFDRPAGDGLITFAIGEAVSLLNIFTQPMRAVRDLKKYEAGYPAAAAADSPRLTWSLTAFPGGIGLRLQF
jgi:hypothetical protein